MYIIRALIGQVTRHACVIAQYASFARAVILTIGFTFSKSTFAVFIYEDVLPMVILFLKFCHSFD